MKRKGLTMIEVLIVIAVIGLLVTLSARALNQAKLKSNCANGNTNACEQLKESGSLNKNINSESKLIEISSVDLFQVGQHIMINGVNYNVYNVQQSQDFLGKKIIIELRQD